MTRPVQILLFGAIILLSQLTACVSGRTAHKFYPDGKEITCFEPPPDYIFKGGEGNITVAVKEIGEVLKAGGSAKLDAQRIREISTGVNDFEVLEFRLCTQYGNKILTADQHQRFQTEILPALKSSPAARTKPESNIRFDAQLLQPNFIRLPQKEKILVQLRWALKPVVSDNAQAAHVFVGMAVIHDQEKVDAATSEGKACTSTPSCITNNVWHMLNQNPVILRGGSDGTILTWAPEIPETVKVVRIYWEFYQREADDGSICQIDSTRPNPSGGTPFLKVVSQQGKELPDGCYKSYDYQVYAIPS